MNQGPPPSILVHDTFTASKRELELRDPGRCGVYCCGPTVYDLCHVGNARAALVPDVIVRFLRHQGLQVKYVRNITDIDDKIIARANADGVEAMAVAERFADEYHRDMATLGMLEPDVEPRVSSHLPEIVELIERLLARGGAYVAEGDVYFRVAAFAEYGKLGKRRPDDLLEGAGSRVEVDARKESPLDFALWKAAKPGEPAWDSPWGPGRPGWHIECSAMCSKHLGETFDIHCGGRDLIFPHHENEIAQSQGAYGPGTFALNWLHNGFIDFAGEKMSKSLGNFFTTREVLALHDPETVRYFLLTVHYRSGLNFEVRVDCPACGAPLDRDAQDQGRCAACGAEPGREALRARVRFPGLEEADDRLAYVHATLSGARRLLREAGAAAPAGPAGPGPLLAAFCEHMRNDFNTSGALGTLSRPLAEANTLLAATRGVDMAVRLQWLAGFLADMDQVAAILGCFGGDADGWLQRRRNRRAAQAGLDLGRVEALVADRQQARAVKDWARSDAIRDELAALGLVVKDGSTGTNWDFA
ncbi:cysteine--tRNA ligase [bacterium]|nr:cysteine--tRNA ligase [bacterium]